MSTWDVDAFTWCKSSYSTENANCVEVGSLAEPWCKSSYSSDQANCVEVSRGSEVVGVRDSKDPGGGFLVVSAQRWRAFISAV